jgi:hypothetical protein
MTSRAFPCATILHHHFHCSTFFQQQRSMTQMDELSWTQGLGHTADETWLLRMTKRPTFVRASDRDEI